MNLPPPPPRPLSALALAAVLSTAGYVLGSYLFYRTGYPLDDAWIYQTYARNLSELREWSFIPGTASGGSTGPLWVLFIVVGYLIRIDHQIWSYMLGSATLFGMGAVGTIGFGRLQPKLKKWAIVAGLLLVLEWHLIWASASSMETLLSALIATFVLVFLFKPEISPRGWLLTGLLIGISVWIRPDGITLLGPAGLAALFSGKTPTKQKVIRLSLLAMGFMIPFGLYLAFNQITAGTIWPNTFYAKQAEYAELRNAPILLRFLQQFITPLAGIGIALLPGFLITCYQALKKRSWPVLASILWYLGYLGIFALRLPVTYQHGRYIIPAMPIFFILGIAGTIAWIHKHFQDRRMMLRVAAKVWLISSFSISGLFWVIGAKAYAEDVAIIESEMVTTAHWIRENTSPEALIAAHDIGALGYFSQRNIVDLAGLISPDVIPFIRDEERLADYLDAQQADYLMTFPGWYPALVSRSTLIYQAKGTFSPKMGGENMAVYQWTITK